MGKMSKTEKRPRLHEKAFDTHIIMLGNGREAGIRRAAMNSQNGSIDHKTEEQPGSHQFPGSDRHQKDGKHRHTRKRIVLTAAVIAGAAVLAAFAGWKAMDSMGRSRLHESGSEGPDLSESGAEGGEGAPDAAEDSREKGEEWKPGWVRWQGDIYEFNSDIMTFLFLGIDRDTPAERGSNGIDGGQADGEFLLILNPDTHKVQILAINRNTMTDVDVYDEEGEFVGTYRLQICLQHGYGDGLEQSCERSVKAVSNLLYGLPVSGYVSLNMGGVAPLVDAVGGVTVPRMTYADGQITTGRDQTLNGEEAYRYIRYRGNDYDAASFRLEKQKEFLKAFVAKVKEKLAQNPAAALTLYNAVSPYVVTDVGTAEMVYLAGQAEGYTFDTDIYSLKGRTTPEAEAATGHEEFVYDEDALYDLMIRLFYRRISGVEPEQEE